MKKRTRHPSVSNLPPLVLFSERGKARTEIVDDHVVVARAGRGGNLGLEPRLLLLLLLLVRVTHDAADQLLCMRLRVPAPVQVLVVEVLGSVRLVLLVLLLLLALLSIQHLGADGRVC